MQVAVIGAGIVGTLTAHYLETLGADVTVFERTAEVGTQTSHANGGQLSYSFCDALADPQILPKLPSILSGFDPAFRIQPRIDWDFVRWGCKFLSECTTKKRDANTLNLLAIALRSGALMAPLLDQFSEDVSHSTPGKLVLLSQPASRELIRRTSLKSTAGVDVRVISPQQALDIEPKLDAWDWRPRAAIYAPGDEVADAHRFTQLLAEDLTKRSVRFRFNATVDEIKDAQDDGCTLVSSGRGERFDAAVVAAGNDARVLIPQFRRLPIIPMAGYSLTLPDGPQSMQTSITAQDHRLVFSRLGTRVRIAGFADINIKSTRSPARIALLKSTAEQLAPDAADYRSVNNHAWQGFRGMTPDSLPLVGPTHHPSVFINLGHGMLGWTLGAATASNIASQVVSSLA